MRGFRETAIRALNATGISRKKNHSSKDALESIRGQLLAGERKALQNLQQDGHTVTTADLASVENAYRPQSVEAPLVVGEQKAHQTLHEPVHAVQPIAIAPFENATSFQSIQSQLLATDYDTLDALHESVFGPTALADNAHSPLSVKAPLVLRTLYESFFATHATTKARVDNVDNPQKESDDDALLVAGEPKALQTLHEPTSAPQTVTPALVETMYSPQLIETRRIKHEHEEKTKVVGIAERKRRHLRRECRQMAAARKRVDQHRARRAEEVSSGVLLCMTATEPSTRPSTRSSTEPSTRPSTESSCTPIMTSPPYTIWSNLAHDKSFYENQTDEESRKYVQERLMSVLGPERMKFELLPSGHNPIDPAIADYHQQSATNHIMEQWEAHKIELRRQEEEQKRRAEEEEAERVRIQILLNHYRERYINRLERLAQYGPNLTKSMDLIETALLAGDHNEAASIMLALSNQVLLPIHGLLTECKQEIPLEEVGADKLKGVWPLERLESMYFHLRGQLEIFPEALDMLQGIDIICTAMGNPTPFQDPLAPNSVPANNSFMNLPTKIVEPAPNNVSSEGLPITSTPSAPAGSGFAKLVQATTQAVNAEQQKDSAPAPSGFAKLLAATAEAVNAEQQKESVPASNGFSKLLTATAEKLKGTEEAGPKGPSANTAPPESATRTAVLQYITTDNMYFECEVQDMVKRNTVVGVHRRNAIKCLKELIDLANGEKGILGDMDAGVFRCQIESCVSKIDMLSGAARLNKETQALKKLCASALMLWSAYTRGLGAGLPSNRIESMTELD